MNVIMPRAVVILALVLAIAAFVLCIIVALSPFVGLAGMFAPATLFLLVGVFPLFLGACLVLARRAKGRIVANWLPILFSGLPEWFRTVYRFYFTLIFLAGFAAFIQAFRGRPNWIGLLFVLVPSVFYAACIGAYWSALRQRKDGEKSLAADADDGAADKPIGGLYRTPYNTQLGTTNEDEC